MRRRLQKEKKFKPNGKFKRVMKKIAKPFLPLVLATAFTFAPHVKNLNPFREKIVLADEIRTNKQVTSDSKINLGGQLVTNEAGASVAAVSNYNHIAGVNVGYLSFFEGAQAPFLTITVTPGTEKKGFTIKNVLSLSFANINSWLYLYEALGIGYTSKFSENWRFSTGVLGGGALSYPLADNIHFKVTWGASVSWKNMVTGYLITDAYFASNKPQESAYALEYGMKFQSIEGGIILNIKNIVGTAFAKYDMIQSIYGVKMGAILDINNWAQGHFWVGGGVSHFTEELGGVLNPVLLAGFTMSMKGRVNTEWYFSHEQYGPGGSSMLPDIDSPPYTKPKTPEEESWEAEAYSKMMSNDTFQEFVAAYEGADKKKLLAVAGWMMTDIARKGYETDAMDALMNLDFFDPNVKRVAKADYEDVYFYMRVYNWLVEEYGSYNNIPEEYRNALENRVAICAIIHAMGAEFLNANGIYALAISMNSKNGPHVVTLGNDPEIGTFIKDYPNTYVTDPDLMPQILNDYMRFNGVPTFYSQFFKPDKKGVYNGKLEYLGTYQTAAARLLEKTVGGGADRDIVFRSFFLKLHAH